METLEENVPHKLGNRKEFGNVKGGSRQRRTPRIKKEAMTREENWEQERNLKIHVRKLKTIRNREETLGKKRTIGTEKKTRNRF